MSLRIPIKIFSFISIAPVALLLRVWQSTIPCNTLNLDTLSKLEKTEGKVKVSDISENLGLPRPSVTKTVKDMEKLGFVEKETTETDGRFVYIKTTRTGRDLVDKYVDEYFGNLSEDLGGITDEDADKMIEVVEKFYIVMSNRK